MGRCGEEESSSWGRTVLLPPQDTGYGDSVYMVAKSGEAGRAGLPALRPLATQSRRLRGAYLVAVFALALYASS